MERTEHIWDEGVQQEQRAEQARDAYVYGDAEYINAHPNDFDPRIVEIARDTLDG